MARRGDQVTGLEPFTINVADAELADLRRRLAATRWAPEPADGSSGYDVPRAWIEELVRYWQDGYDWRAWEERLNAFPQFTTRIDNTNVHFLHIRSPRPDPLPLILTHGWPGSVVEFLDVIKPLTEPRDLPAFDLVIPSLPGFTWSFPDGEWLAYPPTTESADGHLGPADLDALHALRTLQKTSGSYAHVHAQKPDTLGVGLTDSPVALLAWNGQVMRDLDPDTLLTHVSAYWLTRTATSSLRIYAEHQRQTAPRTPTTSPLALAQFRDDLRSIRAYAERDHHNIVSWNTYDSGGHYAAHQAPDLLVRDIREFYRHSTIVR
jgi:pimeloyl-ACP methyl ester carboxylesterase